MRTDLRTNQLMRTEEKILLHLRTTQFMRTDQNNKVEDEANP